MTVPTDTSIPPDFTDEQIREAMNADPDAPYGRTLDGTPKKAPGGRPPKGTPSGKRARSRSTSRPSGAAPPPPRPKPASARKKSGTDYRPGLVGLASVVALPLRFVSPLDCAAVMMNAEELAEAINQTAQERPEVAALCDRALQVGPYGLIMAAFLKLGAQVAENHQWLPSNVTTSLGAVPREQLAQQFGAKVTEQEAAAHPATGAGEPDQAAA